MTEFKELTAVVTATDAGGWTAVASSPSMDRDGEVIAAGAFDPLPASVPVHDGHPLDGGSAPSVRQVGRARPFYVGGALHIEGKFSGSPQAQQLRAMVAEGTIDSMSVMFHNAVRRNVAGVPHITNAELLAVDFVSVPSNRDARVVAVRSALTARDLVDQHLDRLRDHCDALDAIVSDPLNRAYRSLGEAQALLANLAAVDKVRASRSVVAEAEAFLRELNERP